MEENTTCDLANVILDERMRAIVENGNKTTRRPKRVLHFSDGVIEEYSSEDETDNIENNNQLSTIDPKSLNWVPWVWYQTVWASSKMLNGCDYVGEYLANFFGITSPKYQFEINEYHRMQAYENEMLRKEDLEMGGWNEQKRNNLIKDNKP
ncbi:protein FAM177A1 isoform X2 [Cephus cinctus]|uniref:Protein FAM177A1 isoform X2 n=1 Tax=Cephus cinctus TaxID=211228 RepID=A0AAJ7BIN5_CEPCN|nr:protein FAM177A1 isoform X2 [Cephus cinctus]